MALLLFGLAACNSNEPIPEEGTPSGPQAPAGAVQILFTYGSEKQAWIDEVTTRFNASGTKTAAGKPIWVEAVPQGSGEAIDDLLSGARKAHLTSPASAAFVKLGNARSRVQTGKDLVGETRNLVLSPVVVAMWKPMAEALGWGTRPLGWGDVLEMARRPEGWSALGHPEWGRFKLGHTHPEYSNSGLISLLAETYAGAGKVAGLTLADVARPETAGFVGGIESAVVHYGSSTGFFGKRMFAGGPGYLSAAVLYENMVIESYAGPERPAFPVVAVYPREGTFWSDHPVGIVERDWVTPEHREAAEAYVAHLLARPQQEAALRLGFRPADVEIPLAAPIDAAHGVDPKEPKTTLEVPSVEVIDAVLDLFKKTKKRSSITLVMDVSGSMQDGDKISHARDGAEQLLRLLDGEDTLSLLPFNDQPKWMVQAQPVGASRDALISRVQGLFADGGTALYDAVAAAYDYQREEARQDPGRIAALVVLSDGQDTDSSTKLADLLERFRQDGEERGLRVFTIGYGKKAERAVLESIAEASRGRFYAGNPQNIRTVFREISTFF